MVSFVVFRLCWRFRARISITRRAVPNSRARRASTGASRRSCDGLATIFLQLATTVYRLQPCLSSECAEFTETDADIAGQCDVFCMAGQLKIFPKFQQIFWINLNHNDFQEPAMSPESWLTSVVDASSKILQSRRSRQNWIFNIFEMRMTITSQALDLIHLQNKT